MVDRPVEKWCISKQVFLRDLQLQKKTGRWAITIHNHHREQEKGNTLVEMLSVSTFVDAGVWEEQCPVVRGRKRESASTLVCMAWRLQRSLGGSKKADSLAYQQVRFSSIWLRFCWVWHSLSTRLESSVPNVNIKKLYWCPAPDRKDQWVNVKRKENK